MIVQTTRIRNACILCNCMPVDETKETRPPLPMFHAEGVDVNWNEDANICAVCAGVMADLLGRPSAEKYEALARSKQLLRERHEELVTAHEAQSERIREILAGKKAEKIQRKAA